MSFSIKKPLVTEKSSIQAELGFYTFEVDKASTKTQIKNDIEKYFDVKVASVNTLVCRGRSKRTMGGYSKPKYWKKAVVKLQPGEQIKLFEGGN